VFKSIKNQSPHLIGLQEALRFQIDEILEQLPQFELVGVGRDDGKKAGEFSAILFRADRFLLMEEETFWYSDTPETPGTTNWGNTIPRICTWARFKDKLTSQHFFLYNTHLDHRSQPSRERSVQLLSQRIRSRGYPDPVIVTGDFNAGEDNPAIKSLKSLLSSRKGASTETQSFQLVDTFRVIHPEAVEVGTFNGFEGRTDGQKIDYVFVSPGFEILEAEIDLFAVKGRFPSDHFPVTASLLLRD
jgi:endonuclease/exonuclease/phosphatase family metal-dependent hydrolase